MMLDIQNLNAGYGAIAAIREISLEVPEGKVVSIIGANGAGKSTLLKAVSGLNKNRSGRVLFQGKNIVDMPANRIVSLGLSQVAEGRQIFAHMTVEDNIHLGAYLYYKRGNKREIRDRIERIYELFPILSKRARQISGTLSGGEQQMLAIGRALMTRPRLLLLDEPSMGLAPIVVKEIFHTIERLNHEGMTILLVEQNARAALQIADFAYVLETGRVVLHGPASDLINDNQIKEAYLGG
ncbi:ABC transporter ATP-binding protein [Desulfatitalea tepidiphila]|uniref:ABC transporter ATP-binding protein n=1 Tax=Desulfatitalea tepidiphila TaxID=1185843 RepID=UPI003F75D678